MLPNFLPKHKHCSLMSTSGKCRWHWESPRVLLGYYPRLVRSHWPKDPPTKQVAASTVSVHKRTAEEDLAQGGCPPPERLRVHSVPDGPMALRLPAGPQPRPSAECRCSPAARSQGPSHPPPPPLPARVLATSSGTFWASSVPLRAGCPVRHRTYWKARGDIPRAGGARRPDGSRAWGPSGRAPQGGPSALGSDWVKVGQVGPIGFTGWYPLTGM